MASVRAKSAGRGIPPLKMKIPPKLGRLGGQPPLKKISLYFWLQKGPRLEKFVICTRPPPVTRRPPENFRVEGAAFSKNKS